MATETEISAMQRALDAARTVRRTLPNPRVGCVLLAPDGSEIAIGVHRGAGSGPVLDLEVADGQQWLALAAPHRAGSA